MSSTKPTRQPKRFDELRKPIQSDPHAAQESKRWPLLLRQAKLGNCEEVPCSSLSRNAESDALAECLRMACGAVSFSRTA